MAPWGVKMVDDTLDDDEENGLLANAIQASLGRVTSHCGNSDSKFEDILINSNFLHALISSGRHVIMLPANMHFRRPRSLPIDLGKHVRELSVNMSHSIEGLKATSDIDLSLQLLKLSMYKCSNFPNTSGMLSELPCGYRYDYYIIMI